MACETCGGAGEIEAGGALYDGLRICLRLFEQDELPCPDCRPKEAIDTIIELADQQAFNS